MRQEELKKEGMDSGEAAETWRKSLREDRARAGRYSKVNMSFLFSYS